MSKSIIVVSSYVDSTIKEYQIDVTYNLFMSLNELDAYISQTPLHANEIFITKDAMPNINTSLNYLIQMLDNPFLRVDSVVYITDVASPEIASVQYIIKQKDLKNWEIIEGHLNREYVAGVVNGTSRNEELNPRRKAVYRVPKEQYLKERMRRHDSLDEEYTDDEHNLANIPDMQMPEEEIGDNSPICEIYKIVGDDSEERTAFAFLTAQYLSFSGKTLILERDVDFHRLTEFATKTKLPYAMFIEVKDLLTSPATIIERIRQSTCTLIVIGAIERVMYRYNFILSILYNNLMSDVRYIVQEMDFVEAPTTERYTAVFHASVIGILQMVEHIDVASVYNAHFVGININMLPEMLIPNSEAAAAIIKDVLELQSADVQLIEISSLKIGGDSTYDLRSIIGG